MNIELKIENIKRGTLLVYKSISNKHNRHIRLILSTNEKFITSLSMLKTETKLRIKILQESRTQLDIMMMHNDPYLYTLYKK